MQAQFPAAPYTHTLMETHSFLSFCKDVAHFLLSTLHLLLTRILPLIAMLVGSLLLHLFRFTFSFLFPRASFFKKGRSPPTAAPQSAGSASFYRDALAEQPIPSDDDDDDDDGVPHPLQEQSISSDEDTANSALHEECFEDCFDADEDFIEQQRLLLRQYEEMKLMSVSTPAANGEMRGGTHHQPQMSNRVGYSSQTVGIDLQQPNHVPSQEMSDRSRPEAVANSLHQRRRGGRDSMMKVGNSVKEEVGDHTKEEDDHEKDQMGDLQRDAGRRLESQASLFPSDLPRSLDDVVNAAAAVTASGRTSPARRALPPTLSNVQKALHDMVRSEQSPDGDDIQSHANPAASPASSSYDNFFAKFNHHFRLDGR